MLQAQPDGSMRVNVTLREWAILTDIPEVDAGPTYFLVTNEGPDDPHGFLVIRIGHTALGDIPVVDGLVPEDEVDFVDEIQPFEAGSAASIVIDLPPGRYLLLSTSPRLRTASSKATSNSGCASPSPSSSSGRRRNSAGPFRAIGYHRPVAEVLWYRVAARDELAEGDVKTILAGRNVIALTFHEGRYGALDNRCPHENAPLGEGFIEGGWLVCPLHQYEFDPHDGHPSPTFEEGPPAYPVEERDDGVYVGVEDLAASYTEARAAFLAATESAITLIDATEGAREALIDWRRAAVTGVEVEPPAGMPRTVEAARLPNALAIARALRAWHDAYEAMRLAYNRIPREEKPAVARLPEKYPAPHRQTAVPPMTFG